MKKIVTFGEILARFSTDQGQRLSKSNQLTLHYGGAEANVAVSLAQLGHQTAFASKVPNNHLGQGIIQYLKAMNVATDLVQLGGERLGTYYLEVGAGNRGSQVIYDRKHSSFSQTVEHDWDFDALLSDTSILHVTGITPALSESLIKMVEALFKRAQTLNVKVSFDCNYRGKLWSQEQAGTVLRRLLPYVNICSCGELDMVYLFNYAQQPDHLTYKDKLYNYYRLLTDDYPNIEYLLSTKRENLSASHNRLTGYLYTNNEIYQSRIFDIDHIIDRVGGGDAFVAGTLHGIIKDWNPDAIVSFATAASVLKHTIKGDANLVSEEEIKSQMSSENQISR
ncbi:2-dehydro-3-deoxygluconokinase [Amphibacillus marinus]|uniref:2-dehydro-3-deoxygluconokinase n=1 Tax=Amphibacillus marinus TaxID=872970 RepID=A0A1H8QFQ0_9BACI|nr:sugar kinase [Amphibacillus marinus]SEO53042.1 2-dehydro-3-deoxygluconokinase [Amphibacillus marinus]